MQRSAEMTVFVRVAETGSFSAAARSLGLTPSAVSKVISRLEDRLGARLLHRTTRRLSLTHEGVGYYQRSARIIEEIDAAEEAIKAMHREPRGLLRVTAAVAFAQHQIVPLLPLFLERYPEVRLELGVTDRVVDLIEESIDVAIRVNARTSSSLVARLLVEDRRVICAAPAYLERHGVPRTPEDLLKHNCLCWSSGQESLNEWRFRGPAGAYGIPVEGSIATNSGEALYELARAGAGIARLAEFLVGGDIRAGRLVALLTEHQAADTLTIHALYPHRRHLLPKVRVFIDFLVSAFAPCPPWAVTPAAAVSQPPVRGG